MINMLPLDKNIRYTTILDQTAILDTGWWFGTFIIFPYIGDNHPN